MKTAVVTGASSGIGEALARRLARDGWRVLIVARRREQLEALAGELGVNVIFEAADLTDPDSAPRIARRAESEFEHLDLLVNNAGGNRKRGRFGDDDYGHDYVREVMDQNFDSAVRVTEALLPFLRRSAPSSIVNVGSIAGRVGRPKSGAHNAAKVALDGWGEGLYPQGGPPGGPRRLRAPGLIP